ncbi:MAG: sugar ABC transporter ATP-binding protein [Phycisphaerales bacterium]
MPNAFLSARNISKRFGITQALDDVSVDFLRGEVHALMGENGAGKSTLGKAIAGLHKPDSGEVIIDGRKLIPGDLDDAFDAGVRLVHQELAQCPNLSVAENLCLHDIPAARMPLLSKLGGNLVNFRAMRDRAARLVHALDKTIDINAPLGGLSPGRRQICQIAAALDDGSDGLGKSKGKPKVIVLDEPTSSLSVAEADRLMEIVRDLANQGITMIYVSHRMGEIFKVTDRVTILRDGKFVATNVTKQIDEPTLVEQMIGRRIETAKHREFSGGATQSSPVVLEVRNMTSPGKLSNVSVQVRRGEVVGLGGLVGAGRSELLSAIFGLDPNATGEVLVENKSVSLANPNGPIDAKIGYVPEDRRNQGLFFLLGVGENTVLPFMRSLANSLNFRSLGGESSLIRDKFQNFRVKAASPASLPGELSGGNQQKLLIARWMGKDTKVLLLDEPTRGIDVGTKNEVYKLVRAFAESGGAVLLVSSEMPELLALSDRIQVLCEGRITGELVDDQMTQANILRLATLSHKAAS